MPGRPSYRESWIPMAGMLAGIILVLLANVSRQWKAERKRAEARKMAAAAAAAAQDKVDDPPSSRHESLRARVAARRHVREKGQLANATRSDMNRRLQV